MKHSDYNPTTIVARPRLYLAIALMVLGGTAMAQTPSIRELTDKTLVAWAYPANTRQRGGSLLTLIDSAERFDAIVLGERAVGKWMAGSDVFRRTPNDQSAYPLETADAKTLVQMAIAYRGNRISIYRNGKPYADYKIDRPQSFGRDTTVLIGLRYIGSMGEIGPFAGVIEEARIYDVPLDVKTIAALRPGAPAASRPKPIGQWTFEDGTANDAVGTFPKGRLCGGARIADGKLHLSGKGAYMISESVIVESQRMFYKARSKQTGNMWDTWLHFHKGTYYLFYLANSARRWDNISMATSPDGVTWTEHGRVLYKADGVTWMGTGSTWKSPNHAKDGKFFMNFSEWRGKRQTIFFAESTDLLHWKRLGNEFEFTQDTRWYKPTGRWDCIYTIPRPGGGLYGYWTATPKSRGRFGFGQTKDGVKWEALEPPEAPGIGGGEAGAVEKIGEKYYMMFGTHGMMVTLIADKPSGPFLPAKKNYRLLSGHTYFSRWFPTPDGVLANHHSIARNGQVYFGTLKRAVLDAEGTLRLGWWEGNDKLKTKPVKVKAPPAGAAVMLGDTFDVDDGLILEGTIALPARSAKAPVGLYIECGRGRGVGILVAAGGVARLGPIGPDGSGFKPDKQVDRQVDLGRSATFRLLLKHSLLELYLNDILMECYSLPARSTGRIGLFRRKDEVTNLKAWQ